MNVNNILKIKNLDSFKIFNFYEDLLSPFAKAYFRMQSSKRFGLFHEYVFRPDLVLPRILDLHPEIVSDKKTVSYKKAFAHAILPDDLKMGIDIPKLKKVMDTGYISDFSFYVGKACFSGSLEDFFLNCSGESINGYSFMLEKDSYDGYYSAGYIDFGEIDKKKFLKIYGEMNKKIFEISQKTRRLLANEWE